MAEPVNVVFVSGPNRETLVRIGRALVEMRLAACVSVFPEVSSVFAWEGELNVSAESVAMIKTTADQVESVCHAVTELHPYELPECIALDVTGGSARYLEWVVGSCGKGDRDGTA